MAVGAQDYALGDFLSDDRPLVAIAHQRADVVPLRSANVVELEDDGVTLSAIEARVFLEVPEDQLTGFGANASRTAACAEPFRFHIAIVIPTLHP